MVKFNQYNLETNFRRSPTSESFDYQFGKQVEPRRSATLRSKISDAEGLRRSYKQGDYHIENNTMYVAGSHTAKDWWDDITKVPFYGDLRKSTRYQAVDKVLGENPNIEYLVGHSLGGSVVLELQKQYPDRGFKTRTYGAPVFDPDISGTRIIGESLKKLTDKTYKPLVVERYRNVFDPVSIFDSDAKKSFSWNPITGLAGAHGYDNIAQHKIAEDDYPE